MEKTLAQLSQTKKVRKQIGWINALSQSSALRQSRDLPLSGPLQTREPLAVSSTLPPQQPKRASK